LLIIALLAFVVTAVIVVWRRGRGVEEERRIAALDAQVRDLRAQQALLERDLREATGSARIKPAAERRLGLRMPSDSQLITLPRREPGRMIVPDSQ
jgi:outer membrane murein-binding lipoprotein Lpp